LGFKKTFFLNPGFPGGTGSAYIVEKEMGEL